MDTFFTMLIWLGSGFALAVGFFAGMIVMAISCRDKSKADKLTEQVNSLLKERNEIGTRQAVAMERVADVLESARKHNFS